VAFPIARVVLLTLTAIVSVGLQPAQARVVGFDLISRSYVLDGRAIGEVGSYEKIVGTLHFADVPGTQSNHRIVDLERAPRNSRGKSNRPRISTCYVRRLPNAAMAWRSSR